MSLDLIKMKLCMESKAIKSHEESRAFKENMMTVETEKQVEWLKDQGVEDIVCFRSKATYGYLDLSKRGDQIFDSVEILVEDEFTEKVVGIMKIMPVIKVFQVLCKNGNFGMENKDTKEEIL